MPAVTAPHPRLRRHLSGGRGPTGWGGPWGWTQAEALPLVKFEDNLINVDPRFAGKPPADFRLKVESPAYKLGFEPIPLEKIGVYQSQERASWPVEHTLRR